MANQYVNKVIINGETKIDLTSDTVTASKILKGYTAHDKTGAPITGSSELDSKTTDATATAAEILATKTAYVNKTKVTGSMPNRGAVSGSISTKTGKYTIQNGYHDGSGKVGIDSTEQTKIVAENIRSGITILGVEGSMTGTEDVNAETKTATPTFTSQTLTPDTTGGYNYIAQVTVLPIPVAQTDNTQGGVTVTVG